MNKYLDVGFESSDVADALEERTERAAFEEFGDGCTVGEGLAEAFFAEVRDFELEAALWFRICLVEERRRVPRNHLGRVGIRIGEDAHLEGLEISGLSVGDGGDQDARDAQWRGIAAGAQRQGEDEGHEQDLARCAGRRGSGGKEGKGGFAEAGHFWTYNVVNEPTAISAQISNASSTGRPTLNPFRPLVRSRRSSALDGWKRAEIGARKFYPWSTRYKKPPRHPIVVSVEIGIATRPQTAVHQSRILCVGLSKFQKLPGLPPSQHVSHPPSYSPSYSGLSRSDILRPATALFIAPPGGRRSRERTYLRAPISVLPDIRNTWILTVANKSLYVYRNRAPNQSHAAILPLRSFEKKYCRLTSRREYAYLDVSFKPPDLSETLEHSVNRSKTPKVPVWMHLANVSAVRISDLKSGPSSRASRYIFSAAAMAAIKTRVKRIADAWWTMYTTMVRTKTPKRTLFVVLEVGGGGKDDCCGNAIPNARGLITSWHDRTQRPTPTPTPTLTEWVSSADLIDQLR
ncbi:hypothetical protein DFH09DRAFT_1105766 [Mycena vulgaris]|nr:hypothetical protein DFH09DRAFT_1105766 [Mycena vulgaris]